MLPSVAASHTALTPLATGGIAARIVQDRYDAQRAAGLSDQRMTATAVTQRIPARSHPGEVADFPSFPPASTIHL